MMLGARSMPGPNELALVRKLTEEKAALAKELETLKTGGGGGTSGPMEPAVPLKDYVDARDDAVEARLAAKLDTLASKATIWGAVATGTAILLAVMAFGGDRFDSGMAASTVVEEYQARQSLVDQRQDKQLTGMNQKLDELLRRTEAGGTAQGQQQASGQ